MQIVVELPEDIFERLEASWGDVSRGALEAVAVEGDRAGSLTHDDVARPRGPSFWQTDAFLKKRRPYSMYTEAGVEQHRRDIDRVGVQ